MVYIKEAHPSDGWRSRGNQGIDVRQPRTLDERFAVARTCAAKVKISMPAVVDQMQDGTNADYAAWPDRLALVGRGGMLLFYGDRGPRGFRPTELEAAIKKCLAAQGGGKQGDLGGALDDALKEPKK